MKLLIIGNIYSLLMNELIEHLHRNHYEVYILDVARGEYNRFSESYPDYIAQKRKELSKRENKFHRAVTFLKNFLKARRILATGSFDVCNVHFTQYYYILLAGLIKRNSRLFICTVYGSDFNEAGSVKRYLLGMLFNRANVITFTNEAMAEKVNEFYRYRFREKIRTCRFGLNHLDTIERIQRMESKAAVRQRLHLPLDKAIVTCGYGRSKNNQHEKIIRSLSKLTPGLKERIFLIFPMTYGSDVDQIERVCQLMEDLSVPYLVNTVFLEEEIACSYVIAADVFINVPMMDQLNGALQEMLFTGNHVINGSWLPYKILYDLGIDASKVDSCDEIGPEMEKIMDSNIGPDVEKNRRIIKQLSGWDAVLQNWMALYNEGTSAKE